MKTLFIPAVLFFLAVLAPHADAERSKASPEANVYIISPAHGETVHNPVTVRFGLKGMGVAPAGVAEENRGHHHLLVDVKKLPPFDAVVPKDDNHLHFGAGQTETTLTLPPGKHTLQLLVGDHRHIPHDPPVISEQITITVK